MIKDDRTLLYRMATVNQALGDVVSHMLDRMQEGRLSPDDLRTVGRELQQLGQDMRHRADDIDRTIDVGLR